MTQQLHPLGGYVLWGIENLYSPGNLYETVIAALFIIASEVETAQLPFR